PGEIVAEPATARGPERDQRPGFFERRQLQRLELPLGGEPAGPTRRGLSRREILGALGERADAGKHLVGPILAPEHRQHDAPRPPIDQLVERGGEGQQAEGARAQRYPDTFLVLTHVDEAEVAHGVSGRVEIGLTVAKMPRQLRRAVRPYLTAVVDQYPTARCVHPPRPRTPADLVRGLSCLESATVPFRYPTLLLFDRPCFSRA